MKTPQCEIIVKYFVDNKESVYGRDDRESVKLRCGLASTGLMDDAARVCDLSSTGRKGDRTRVCDEHGKLLADLLGWGVDWFYGYPRSLT